MFLQDLLAVRDAGEGATAPRRAMLLAALAAGPVPVDPEAALEPDPSLTAEPVGRTTARLLRLRERLAGHDIEATVTCTACASAVEFSVDDRELLALEPGIVDAPAPLRLGDREITWRPVTYEDLGAALDDAGDPGAALLRRCASTDPDGLTPEARAALVRAMAEADPLLELDYDLSCPQCGAGVRATVDVASFVWAEVEAQARVLLAEVDVLARAYSWTEEEILGLPPARRARYVELVTGAG